MIRRLKQLERIESEFRTKIKHYEPITLLYQDGREVHTVDNMDARHEQVAGAIACYSYFDGWQDSLPPDTCIGVIHEDGTREDFIEWAQKPPMTAAEARQLLDEIANNC